MAGPVSREITEQKRLEEEQRRQNEYLAALHETALGLITRRDVETLLQVLLERAAALLGTSHGFIYLLEPGATRMELRVAAGAFGQQLGSEIERGQGLAGRVWQTGRSLVLEEEGVAGEEMAVRGWQELAPRIGVPLLSDEQVVGVLGLVSREGGDLYRFDEIAVLSQFARLASVAIDNARLYEAVRRELAERRRAEEALRRSEARYRTLFESAGDAIFIHDLEGRFLEANSLACQRLGYGLEELRQLGPADVEAPEYAARLPARIEELRACGHDFFETVYIRRDGSAMPVELSSRLIEYEGHPAVLSIARDITERKQMQRMLLRTERLAAMGHLAAALAHEINNPLQSVGSSMELALDFPLEEEERREYLEAVRQEIERLMSVTGRILDFARPGHAERQLIAVGDVLRYALTLADKQFQHSRIRINLDLAEGLPLIMASRDELAQVFLNLVINALEAMPGGGRLEISARAGDGQVEVVFADSGPGIPPGVADRLFEPFQTTKEEGTGLGLALSYSIIQQHGGSISGGNAPGGGALFRIVLPQPVPAEARDEEAK